MALTRRFAVFQKTTTGKTLVMGRKTYESLGKALPNRKTIVLTRDQGLKLDDAEILHSKEAVLALAETGETIYIVGGAEIYRLFMDVADQLIVTKIDAEFEADTAFPEVDWENFSEVAKEFHEKDEKISTITLFIRMKEISRNVACLRATFFEWSEY